LRPGKQRPRTNIPDGWPSTQCSSKSWNLQQKTHIISLLAPISDRIISLSKLPSLKARLRASYREAAKARLKARVVFHQRALGLDRFICHLAKRLNLSTLAGEVSKASRFGTRWNLSMRTQIIITLAAFNMGCHKTNKGKCFRCPDISYKTLVRGSDKETGAALNKQMKKCLNMKNIPGTGGAMWQPKNAVPTCSLRRGFDVGSGCECHPNGPAQKMFEAQVLI